MTSGVLLSSKQLLTFDGWDAKSKAFIKEQGDGICLEAVVETYASKVRPFYDWFYERLSVIHADDLARLVEKREELRRAHYTNASMFLETGLHIHAKGAGTPDEIFRSALVPDDREKVVTLEHPLERCEAAIDAIERHVRLDERLVQSIRAAYR